MKKKSTEFLFSELEKLGVDPIQIGALRIQHGMGGIGICLSVSKIVLNFNSSIEIEDKVTDIIGILLKRHFK